MWQDEPEVVEFLYRVLGSCSPSRIVELGSFSMHDHDPRPLWPGIPYVGVDNRAGPGVELICLAHEARHTLQPNAWDLVLSVSALEHDPHWQHTLLAAVELVSDGGTIAVTCAGPGWGEHELECAPEPGYYGNRSTADVVNALMHGGLRFGKGMSKIDTWYAKRTCLPAWDRTCVIARYGGTPLGSG